MHAPSGPCLALLAALAGCRPPTPRGPTVSRPVDRVLIGGRLATLDPARPFVSAVAITDGRFVAVGSDEEIRRLVGPGSEVIDLRGRFALPALADAHAHLYSLGRASEQIDLVGCASADACAARLRGAAAQPGEWLLGRGWDQNRFADGRFPDHRSLDEVAGERPVWLRRIDGHAGWANRRALELAGVNGSTVEPKGGRILRRPDGPPSGVLVDEAMALVERAIPEPTAAARERAILAGQELALAQGLTSVHEMGIDEATIAAYRALDEAGRLHLRIYAFAEGSPATTARLLASPPAPPGRRFTCRGIKLFADGALGSRGAALIAPYADDLANHGLVLAEPTHITAVARRALATGWQIAVHAIGDRANRNVLDAFADAGCDGAGDHRFRIEHAQLLTPEDWPRFARLGVIASMQPTHATSDMPWAEARLGKARLRGAYAWRSLATAGARLAFGSDFPVEKVTLVGGLHAAVTRTDESGQPPGGWLPEERLTIDAAVAAFTSGAAFAAFAEGERGRIAPGQQADLTVLDRDVLADPSSLLKARVELTLIGGEVAFRRP